MTLFSSLRRHLKTTLAVAGLAIVPLGAMSLPSILDEAPAAPVESSLYAATDTTYDSGLFVILKTATCSAGICFFDGPWPDQFVSRWKQDGLSFLLLTYETGFGAALDSAAVDSIWSDWGYGAPLAYAVNVPGQPQDTTYDYIITFAKYATDHELRRDMSTGGTRPTDSTFISEGQAGDTVYIYLDSDAPPGYTNSMRYDFVYPDSASTCVAQTVQRQVAYPFSDYAVTHPQRIWMEFAIKWDTDFSSGNTDCAPADYKSLLFSVYPASNFRHGLHLVGCDGQSLIQSEQVCIYWPSTMAQDTACQEDIGFDLDWTCPLGGTKKHVSPTKIDGQWHIVRWYIDHGTNSDSSRSTNSFDSRSVVWLDGDIVYDTYELQQLNSYAVFGAHDRLDTANELWLAVLDLGANKDKANPTPPGGFPNTESLWWGYVKFWETDPGWLVFPDDTSLVNAP